jgi:hypothetical protein
MKNMFLLIKNNLLYFLSLKFNFAKDFHGNQEYYKKLQNIRKLKWICLIQNWNDFEAW